MLTFFQQIFRVAWSIISVPIPVGGSLSISVWQIMLGAATITVIVKFLINKGSTE